MLSIGLTAELQAHCLEYVFRKGRGNTIVLALQGQLGLQGKALSQKEKNGYREMWPEGHRERGRDGGMEGEKEGRKERSNE